MLSDTYWVSDIFPWIFLIGGVGLIVFRAQTVKFWRNLSWARYRRTALPWYRWEAELMDTPPYGSIAAVILGLAFIVSGFAMLRPDLLPAPLTSLATYIFLHS